MKRIIYTLIDFILFCTFTIFSSDAFVTIENVQVQIPEGWAFLNFSYNPPVLFQALAPARENQRFQENINMTKTEVKSGTKSREIREQSMSILEDMFSGIKVVDEERSGKTSYWYIFEYPKDGEIIKAKQLIIVKSTYAYVITATALRETFDSYQFHFNRVINSIKIK